jgi:opacity protein-like surface antigen
MRSSIAVAFALLCLPAAARGQDDRGASVGGGVSATNMESRTEWSFSGAFGYRFGRVVGLELDATVVPTVRSSFQNPTTPTIQTLSAGLPASIQIFPPPSYTNPNGRTVIFSNNVRVTIPTTTPRLEPFFIVGGGIASVRRTADFVYPIPLPLPLATPSPPGVTIPVLQFRTVTQHVTSSSVDLALTLGGGLSIRVASQVWVDADLRMFRLLGDQDENVGRFGVGVRYRF